MLGLTDRASAQAALARMAALDRSQAVIEFELDGTIVTANENFLRVLGYSLVEI
jgi:methyl-accepting chemotaxis protein